MKKNEKKHTYKNYFCGDNFESLTNDFAENKSMALFLGAGINISKDVRLDWNSLLDHLFEQALTFITVEKDIKGNTLRNIRNLFDAKGKKDNEHVSDWTRLHRMVKNDFPSLMKASIIKEVLGKNYISSIQSFLYKQCNRSVLRDAFDECYSKEKNDPGKFYSLYQLARLILLYPNIRAVITYNFDNFLSEAIRLLYEEREKFFTDDQLKIINRRLKVKSDEQAGKAETGKGTGEKNRLESGSKKQYETRIVSKIEPVDISSINLDTDLKHNIIPVYHIHGYIPPPYEITLCNDNEIVLSMDEFYDIASDVFSWQTTTQLHYLSHFTCIFSGLSLTDLTTQKIIFNAHKQNSSRKMYYLTAADTGGLESIDYVNSFKLLKYIKNCFYASYGLSPYCQTGGYAELYRRFNDIIIGLTEKEN